MNRWQQLATRFANLQPREQIMVAAVCVVITLALCDSLFWSPLRATSKSLHTQQDQLSQQLQNLVVEHTAVKAQLAIDPDLILREQLFATLARVNTLNRQLQELTVNLISPSAMPGVLRNLIEHRKGIKLIALTNAPAVQAFSDPKKPEDKDTKNSGIIPIYKHALTLTFKGSYFDTLEYLQAVEALPWRFFWQHLEYSVDHFPEAEVKLEVYTLGDQKEWIGA